MVCTLPDGVVEVQASQPPATPHLHSWTECGGDLYLVLLGEAMKTGLKCKVEPFRP